MSSAAHIVVNALSARTGGGLTYARNFLARIEPRGGIKISVLAAPWQREMLPDGPYEFVSCGFAGRGIVHQLLWERFVLPRLLRRLSADVYYVLSGTLAGRTPAGCKSVVAFRNLLPFTPEFRRCYPLGYIRLRLAVLRVTQARSMQRADLVIFVSEHGRDVIGELLPNRRGRTVVIPHGVGGDFVIDAPPEGDGDRSRWPGGYVFYASILDVYKAQIEVVEAWAALRRRCPTPEKLVLGGPEFEPYGERVRRRIAELSLEDEVVMIGPVSHAELVPLYRGAIVNVFASRCENCPNILLEALASGRPIVCSTDPPMPEFGGDAVLYFDPPKPEQLTDQLARLLDDPESRRRLGRAAHEHSREYSVDRAMRETWQTLADLALED